MKKILVIDIETTGFLNNGGKIVEVGIVELGLADGKSKILFDNVCHETPITKEEVQNSWICKNGYMCVEEIQHSKNLKTYLPEIQKIIDSYENGATTFNRSFDINFLTDRGIVFKKLLPCPMALSILVCRIPPTENMKRWKPNIKFKTPNAQEVYNYFFPDSKYIEKHRGADDALHEA